MAEGRQETNRRKKKSERKKTKPPRQRSKQNERSVSVSGTLQFRRLVEQSLDQDERRVTTDPFDEDFSAQFAGCVDTSNFQITAAQVCKMQQHTTELVAADSDYPLRYCWVPPLLETVQTSTGTISKADSRGQYVGINRATVTVRNTSPVEVKFRANTPKAPMYRQYDAVLRSHETKNAIQPGTTMSHTITWSNTKRDSPHFTASLGKDSKNGVSLFDFYTLMPDVDPESNTEWNPQTTILDVSVAVHYQVETNVPEGVTITTIKPFMLATLGNFYNMFYVENEIAGLYSGASQRQLLTDGMFFAGKAQISAGFTIDGFTWPAGEYYILFQGPIVGGEGPQPINVPGAPMGSILQLPTEIIGTTKSRIDADKRRAVVTRLAFNIGSNSAKIAVGVPGQGQLVKGSTWVIISSFGEPVEGISFTTATPGGAVPGEFAVLFGKSLLVNYWPEWFILVPKKTTALQHMRHMQDIGISLMTVVLVIEAAYKIVSIITGTKKTLDSA